MNLSGLISWLRFNNGVTDDFVKKNQWEAFGNPTVGTANAINGNALQLDGQSYIKLSGVELGGADFEIDGWVYVDSSSPNYARLINIVNPSNGEYLMRVYKSSDDSTKLEFWHNSTADVSNSAGYTRRSDTVSIGERVHFKLIYQRTTSYAYIKLCVNDKIAASWQSTYSKEIPEYNRQKFDIYIGGNPNGSQGLIGSIDEVTIYDGTWYAHNNGNVPTADYYAPPSITLNADTARKVLNPPLTWRYENYGSADLLTQAGTTLTNLPATQSKTGSAFYQPTRAKCFDIPATKEIWIKCDIYTTANYTPTNGDRIRIYSEDSNGVNGWCTFNSNANYALWHNGTKEAGSDGFAKNKLRPILLHMVSDSTNGIVEYFFASGDKQKFTGNVNDGNDFNNVYIQMDGSNILVSNLIISNSPLELADDVAQLRQESVEFTADTLRLIGNAAEIYFDTSRNIVKPIEIIYPTARNIVKPINLSFDTSRKVSRAIDLNFDTLREIQFDNSQAEEIYFDTKRNIVKSTELLADTLRNVKAVWRIEYDDLHSNYGDIEIPPTNEIWIRFNLLTNSFVGSLRADCCRYDDNNEWHFFGFALEHEECRLLHGYYVNTYSEEKEFIPLTHNLTENDNQNFLIHMKSGVTDGFIKILADGNLIGLYTGNVNDGIDFDLFEYYWTRGTDGAPEANNFILSNAPLSKEEIGFDENVQFPQKLFFDTERRITYAGIWRYENYGTANLLLANASTVPADKTQAIYQQGFVSTARQNYFDISHEKELWIKFDFCFTQNYETLFVGSLDNEKTNQVRLNCDAAGEYARLIFALSENVVSDTTHQFYSQRRYSAVLHLKSDSTNGKIEFFCSDGYNLTYTGNVNNGDDFANVYIQASNYNDISTYPIVSNVIVSNGEVGINENTKMPFSSEYDISRSICQPLERFFDTKIIFVKSQIFYADSLRILNYSTEIDNDTCRDIRRSVQVDFDIASSIPHNLIVMPIPVMDFSESQNTDDINNKFLAQKKNSLLADSPALIVAPSTDNITKGTQSVELNLYAQQLTDQLSYSSVNPAAIMEAVHGQYLDYVFNVRVEKSSKRGAVYSFKCCSDIDEILYRQLDYQIPEDEQWHKGGEILVDSEQGIYESVAPMCMAGEHITHIAENMGKQPMLFFADFVSTVDVNAGGVTYHDLISSIFGWSSRVPNMLINVFLRGDKMFVVQRGHEPNTIDLTGTKHTVPNIDCELVRTAWGASVWSETETRSRKKFVGDLDFAPDPPPSGSGKEKDTEEHDDYSFDQEGLVTRSEVREGNTRTVTTYEYVTVGKRKYLSREEAYIYEGDELVDTKITKHTYLGQGQMHSTSNDEEGSYLGGSVGASKGNDRRTPYDEYNYKLGGYTYDKDGNKKYIKSYKFGTERYEESRKVYGLPLFDTSFPVYEEEKLIEITNDINWLNRRTKETISMSIYDYPHLIDFTDKIIFEGNEYFLENNTATTTPRIINRQDVSFVRWY